MNKYNFLLCSRRNRIKYPKSFYLTDTEAARQVGFRIARASGQVIQQWEGQSWDQQKNFAVEVVDGTFNTVLTIPIRAAEEAKS